MTVYEIIKVVIKGKKKNKLFPLHVTDKEIMKHIYENKLGVTHESVKNELNTLCKEKKIQWGNTINNIYFKLS